MQKTRQWMVLTAMGAVAILVAGWFLVVSPQHKHAADLRSQASSVEGNNVSLQSQVHQLQLQQAGVPAEQRKLAAIATKIPDNPALPALIRQLSDAASGAGVDLVSLSPGTPVAVAAAAGGATTLPSGAAASTAPLLQIPVTLQVSGGYFNTESFFNAVENMSRAMMVSTLTMAPGAGPAAAGGTAKLPDNVTTQITAVIFESPSVTPAAPATVTPGTTTAATTTAPATSASAPSSTSSSTSSSGR